MGVALSTQAVHADDHLNEGPDVAPPLHVATTFRYPKDPDRLVPVKEVNVGSRDGNCVAKVRMDI